MFDTAGLEVLSEADCFQLMGKVSVGRIVFTERALPAIQPVSFAVHDHSVIIRTSAGSKLAAAARNSVVAFEVDEFDSGELRSGWSVVCVGHAGEITDPVQLSVAKRLALRTWGPVSREHYIRIGIEMISGRRLNPHSLNPHSLNAPD